MGLILDRTVRRIENEGSPGPSEPLAKYRETPAWVLLGDPGAGKTTAFKKESRSWESAHFVSARDFLTFDLARHPEWCEGTLLIDGLDEVRAGQDDARKPFDKIRKRLDRLGRPKFRLSCREADWLGNFDREPLKAVSPDGEIVVLRLDPLSDDDARRLVSERLDIAAQAAFFTELADRGLEPLLGNPQNLELLAQVFSDSGELPASRLETFEKASALLAHDKNKEHRTVGDELPVESLLDAAGWLSAVQLLSGAVGHCDSADAPDGYIPISTHDKDRRADIRAALRTRLFAADGEGRFRPAHHAHFAAFLAARCLARLVEEGIPGNRILARLAGYDSVPPTPLRGLAAWLAAASPDLRRSLIERDPVAVLMYGDVSGFTPAEKASLLDSLGSDPLRLYEAPWPSSAIVALASEDMETELLARFPDADRSYVAQSLVELITRALSHGGATGALADALLAVVKDPTYGFRVRRSALDAWIAGLADEPDQVHRLRTMLDMIHKGHIKDTNRQLLGTLLTALYPGHFVSAEVWDYFDPPSRLDGNRYLLFWFRLGEDSPDEHLPDHLDCLSDPDRIAPSDRDRRFLQNWSLQLLARALVTYGTKVDTSRLFRWLQVGMEAPGKLTPLATEPTEPTRTVTKWLREHPDIQKELIRFALRTEEFRALESADYELSELLYRSTLPDDIGQWHLDEAVATDDCYLMERHMEGFLNALKQRPVDVDNTLAVARDRLADRPEAVRFLDENLKSVLPEWHIQQRILRKYLPTGTARTDTDLVEAVRSNSDKLLANAAPPALLDWVAKKYYEYQHSGGQDSGRAHVLEALGGDESLLSAALGAIHGAVERADLPSANELVRQRRQGYMSDFVWPVLVGLEDKPAAAAVLGEERLRSALVCRLLESGVAGDEEWYARCLKQSPGLVAEVLVLTCRVLLKTGETSVPDFFRLDNDDHAPVAREATLPLLQGFPSRPKKGQLGLLDALLRSGLRHFDADSERDDLRTIIESKANQKSCTQATRARWLAAGLVLDPKRFIPDISDRVACSQARIRSFAKFFEPLGVNSRSWLFERLSLRATAFLIHTLGPTHEPPSFLSNLIRRLSEFPDQCATGELLDLTSNQRFSKWRPNLEYARDTQRVVRRDADYRPPAPGQVIEALRDGPPAGAADLRALVVDRLKGIAKEARDTGANLWRQFWNEDSYGRPKRPKHEESCRDALLARLEDRLPAGCNAEKEVQCAGDMQADLQISCGEWKVPVEIKKNSHRELWRAVGNQLLPRYANDPATEGLGIYLVLWLGPEEKMPLSPDGRLPKTPEKLQEWLLAALTLEERRRAAVLVMDVTPP